MHTQILFYTFWSQLFSDPAYVSFGRNMLQVTDVAFTIWLSELLFSLRDADQYLLQESLAWKQFLETLNLFLWSQNELKE